MFKLSFAKGFALAGALVLGSAMTARATTVYSQGFETDTAGWYDSSNGWYGSINQVTGPLTPAAGTGYAVVSGDANSAPFTRFGGYSAVFGSGFTTSIDIYLDKSWAAGSGFDYSVSASDSSGNFLRDFIFHVTQDTSTGTLLVGASNNSSDTLPDESLENGQNSIITSSGWYTFQQVFKDTGGFLTVDMDVLDSLGNTVFTQTLGGIDAIGGVGGNHYGWFTFAPVPGNLAIDNVSLTVAPLPTVGYAGLALIGVLAAKRKFAKLA